MDGAVETTNRDEQLARFRAGYSAVEAAVAGVADADLDRRPADGGWTAREVVHHLADMEAHAYVRLRRLLAEAEPRLQAHDEDEYARRLHYDRPIASSLAVVRAVREASVDLLLNLTPEEWTRSGVHPERGSYSVERWLRIYAEHPHRHADQVRIAIGSAADGA